MKKRYFFLVCVLLMQYVAKSQMKIGDSSTKINAASLLELQSTNKGFVPPRVSLADVSLPDPLPSGLLTGTIVFNTNDSVANGSGVGLYLWNGGAWVAINTGLTSATAWSLAGNTGTNSTNFLGTTDNISLRMRTNSIQRILVDSLGSVAIGSEAFDTTNRERLLVDYGNTTSNTIATFKGNIADHLKIKIQNTNATGTASTDIIATASDGTDSSYIDMGINSKNYNPGPGIWGAARDAYLYVNSRRLLLGTQASNSDIIFLSGGGKVNLNTVFKISGTTGNVIIGNGDSTNKTTGNILRGPNGAGTDVAGGFLTIQGGSGAGTGAAGNLNLLSGLSGAGDYGPVNIFANPLNIYGVQSTASFSTDSILTIYNGTLK
jgi:hypothetical protein